VDATEAPLSTVRAPPVPTKIGHALEGRRNERTYLRRRTVVDVLIVVEVFRCAFPLRLA
jgi:hypothetical protein